MHQKKRVKLVPWPPVGPPEEVEGEGVVEWAAVVVVVGVDEDINRSRATAMLLGSFFAHSSGVIYEIQYC
jgi:hypothetical protein